MLNKFRPSVRIFLTFLVLTLSSISPSAYSCGGTAECDTYEQALSAIYNLGAGWARGNYDWCKTAGQECVYMEFYPRNTHPDRPISAPNWTLWRYSLFYGVWLEEAIQFIRNPVRKEKNNGDPLADFTSGPFHGAKSCNALSQNSNNKNTLMSTCFVGNPINLATGNKVQKETDIAGTGKNIKFQRFYNSQTTQPYISHMGKKWSHTYSRLLIIQDALIKVLVRHTNKKILIITYPTDPRFAIDADIVGKFTRVKNTAGVTIAWEFKDTRDAVERYDLNGRLISIQYLNGNVETLTYDTSNRLLKVTNSYGYSLTFAYDTSNRVSSVTDQAGRIWTYLYDTNNNLLKVAHPDTTTTQYHYELTAQVNALTGITDRRNIRYANFEYDSTGKATASYHGATTSTLTSRINGVKVVYNANGTRTATDSRNNAVSYNTKLVNGIPLVTQMTGPPCTGSSCANSAVSYTQNATNGDILSKVVDGVTTQYSNYDSNGNPKTIVYAAGTPSQRQYDYTFDARFTRRILTTSGPSVCSAQKKITAYTYNAVGKITQRTINGFTPQCIPVSRTFTYEYNGPVNQLSKIDGPRTDVSDISIISYYPLSHANSGFRGRIQTVTNALGINTVSAVQYSTTGKILSYVDANGITYNMTYYAGNDWLKSLTQSKAGTSTTTSWTYLNTGEVSTITQNAGTPDAMVISFSYDQARRLTRITDGTGNSIQYTLDTEGNRTATQQFDPNGILTKQLTQTFDVYNRLSITQQVNESVTQSYNTDGTTSTTTDGKSSVTQYSYDAIKRLTQTVMDVNGSNTSTQNAIIKYSYDIADRLTQVVDPNNGTTTHEYDDLGNRLKTTSADTGTKTMTHDAAGNVLTLTDAKGQVFTYVYDVLNRLTSINAPGTTDDITYVFDACANGVLKLCSTTYGLSTAGANTVSFAYDNLGSVSNHQNTAYTYDISRRVKTVTYPNSRTVLTYQYDAAGRISSLSVSLNGSTTGTTLASNILYSPFGPIKSLAYGNGKTLTQTVDQAYRFSNINIIDALILNYPNYDANGNILKKTNNTVTGSVIDWTYSYDPLNRLTTTGELLNALSYQYQYDKNGNRLQKTENTTTSNYGYDPNSNRLNLINTTTINRDANGNTLNQNGFNYVFNPYNRLITVTQGVSPNITTVGQYQYNALGQRIQKIITGTAASSSYLITKKDLRKLKKSLRAAKQTETLSTACTTLQTWVKNELVQYNSTPGYRADNTELMTQLNACVLIKPRYNRVKQRLLDDIAAGYRVTRKKLRKLKKAMRAAAKTETLSAECLTLQTWIKNELIKFRSNNQYRPDASQLMAQLKVCVLTNARYNKLKQSILTPTTTTAVDSTIIFSYGLNGSLLSENNSTTNAQKDYVYLNGKPLAMIVHTNNAGTITSQVFTIHNDHLGTPYAMTNSTGINVWTASYGPFGQGDPDEDVNNNGNSVTLDIRFPGQYYDKETGLHYNYFRVYDPNSGRYITSDPIGLRGGLNTFGYVGGNPNTNFDIYGLFLDTGRKPSLLARIIRATPFGAGLVIGGWIGSKIPTGITATSSISKLELAVIDVGSQCRTNTDTTECDRLNEEVQIAKKKIGTLGKCRAGMSKYELNIRKEAWLELATSRARRDQICWNGGDLGHQREQANVWKNVSACANLLR